MRYTAEVNQANMKYPGDIEMIKPYLTYTVEADVSCCIGSHDLCKKYSLVCKGGNNNWIERSAVLPPDFVVWGNERQGHQNKTARKCELTPWSLCVTQNQIEYKYTES